MSTLYALVSTDMHSSDKRRRRKKEEQHVQIKVKTLLDKEGEGKAPSEHVPRFDHGASAGGEHVEDTAQRRLRVRRHDVRASRRRGVCRACRGACASPCDHLPGIAARATARATARFERDLRSGAQRAFRIVPHEASAVLRRVDLCAVPLFVDGEINNIWHMTLLGGAS